MIEKDISVPPQQGDLPFFKQLGGQVDWAEVAGADKQKILSLLQSRLPAAKVTRLLPRPGVDAKFLQYLEEEWHQLVIGMAGLEERAELWNTVHQSMFYSPQWIVDPTVLLGLNTVGDGEDNVDLINPKQVVGYVESQLEALIALMDEFDEKDVEEVKGALEQALSFWRRPEIGLRQKFQLVERSLKERRSRSTTAVGEGRFSDFQALSLLVADFADQEIDNIPVYCVDDQNRIATQQLPVAEVQSVLERVRRKRQNRFGPGVVRRDFELSDGTNLLDLYPQLANALEADTISPEDILPPTAVDQRVIASFSARDHEFSTPAYWLELYLKTASEENPKPWLTGVSGLGNEMKKADQETVRDWLIEAERSLQLPDAVAREVCRLAGVEMRCRPEPQIVQTYFAGQLERETELFESHSGWLLEQFFERRPKIERDQRPAGMTESIEEENWQALMDWCEAPIEHEALPIDDRMVPVRGAEGGPTHSLFRSPENMNAIIEYFFGSQFNVEQIKAHFIHLQNQVNRLLADHKQFFLFQLDTGEWFIVEERSNETRQSLLSRIGEEARQARGHEFID